MSKSITVRYSGLEILCKPGTILGYRNGKLPMSNVVITDDAIYKSVKNGNVASDNDLTKAFGSLLPLNECLDIMLQKGDFQMTTKERQELTDKRYAQLLEYFHQNFVDPKTNSPHPIVRLEATFKQIKAKVNYSMPFDKNAEDIRKNILGVLPIKPKDNASGAVVQPKVVKTPKPSSQKPSYGRKKGGKSRFNKN